MSGAIDPARLDNHEERLRVARAQAHWHIGDSAWADDLIAAYCDPDAARERLQKDVDALRVQISAVGLEERPEDLRITMDAVPREGDTVYLHSLRAEVYVRHVVWFPTHDDDGDPEFGPFVYVVVGPVRPSAPRRKDAVSPARESAYEEVAAAARAVEREWYVRGDHGCSVKLQDDLRAALFNLDVMVDP